MNEFEELKKAVDSMGLSEEEKREWETIIERAQGGLESKLEGVKMIEDIIIKQTEKLLAQSEELIGMTMFTKLLRASLEKAIVEQSKTWKGKHDLN